MSRRRKRRKYKSLLEKCFSKLVSKCEYEADTFAYVRPSHYTPDWKIGQGSYIETKGEFAPSQRANLLAFREQHPRIKIHLVFSNASNKIHKHSETTYGEWAEKNGFLWHDLKAVYNKDTRDYTFGNPNLPTRWFKQSGTEKTH